MVKITPMELMENNELKLRAEQAKSEFEHYESLRKIDARSRWMGYVLTLNCIMPSVLLLKIFSE